MLTKSWRGHYLRVTSWRWADRAIDPQYTGTMEEYNRLIPKKMAELKRHIRNMLREVPSERPKAAHIALGLGYHELLEFSRRTESLTPQATMTF